MDEIGAPIVPIAPEEPTETTDETPTRPDGGLKKQYETAQWGAPLVPEF